MSNVKRVILALLALGLLLPLLAAGNSLRTEDIITVGDGDQLNRIPVDVYYRTSLFETVFQGYEIGSAGSITELRFYNNFVDNILDRSTMIWLGETQEADLSGGWIPSGELTEVFNGTVDYLIGQNTISIELDNPYVYAGGNLVMMVFMPWEDDYHMSMNNFYCQTWGNSRSLYTYNHNTTIDPNNPPTTGVTGQFPKTSFVIDTTNTGVLVTDVSENDFPLAGATVRIDQTGMSYETDLQGVVIFDRVLYGDYTVTAFKLGYTTQTLPAQLSEDQWPVFLSFNLQALDEITVQGRVVGSDNPSLGISGAEISFSGAATYTTTTDASGYFVINDVYALQSYTYTISAPGYQVYHGLLEPDETSADLNMGNVILSEVAHQPTNVSAELDPAETEVNLAWEAPVVTQEAWLHYDSGSNYSSFGTAGSMSFEVAARFPADSLVAYAGGFLQAVRFWPAQGGNYVIKVWTGGNAEGPGILTIEQPVIPVLNAWNSVELVFPIPITGNEEIWIGFLCDVTGVNPAYAGFDEGPAVDGYGNLIYWQGSWTTLLAVNSYCDFNWNLQGYAGLTAPDGSTSLVQIGSNSPIYQPREQIGYHVWRLLHSQVNNPGLWIGLTDEPITELSLVDPTWESLPDGTYIWAVRTVYTGGVMSDPAFSNSLDKVNPVGTITGFVRDGNSAPISQATVSCAGMNVMTNTNGVFSLLVPPGTYSVTASHLDYLIHTIEDVEVQSGEVTVLNFVLEAVAISDEHAPVYSTALLGNSPNPFRGFTTIAYSLKESTELNMDIFDLKGRLIRSYGQSSAPKGPGSITWDGRDEGGAIVASGLYFIRMQAGDYTQTRKMMLLR